MQYKTKASFAGIIVLLMLSFALASTANAAGAITLTPNTNVAVGGTVSVSGTGFGASKAVGIGLGTEVVVTNETTPAPTGSGGGPWSTTTAHKPIKPGSFSFHSNVGGVESDWTDKGDGTLTSDSPYITGTPTVNYVTGVFQRSSSSDLTGMDIAFTASYTYYQYSVTPAAGVTTSASGTFSASITIPTVPSAVYTVTAIDTQGTKATSQVGVGTPIPESLTVGAVVLLSSAAVVASAFLLRKPKVKSLSSSKL